MSLTTTPKHPTSLYQNKRNLERSPYFAMKNLPLGGCQSNESPLSFLFFSILLQRKNPFFLLSLFLSLPKLPYLFFPQMISLLFVPLILRISPHHPMRAATEKESPPLNQKSSPTYIYHLLNPKSVPERKKSPIFLFFSPYPFLNLPIQKQSS